MTEEEAENLWCPYGFGSESGACKGSGCYAWGYKTPAPALLGDGSEPAPRDDGFCCATPLERGYS